MPGDEAGTRDTLYGKHERYRAIFEPTAPLVIGSGIDVQNHRRTLHHIPGGAVRGCIGALVYQGKPRPAAPLVCRARLAPKDDPRDALFARGGVLFGPLFPVLLPQVDTAGRDLLARVDDMVVDAFVLPQTMMSCKRKNAFKLRSAPLGGMPPQNASGVAHQVGEGSHRAGDRALLPGRSSGYYCPAPGCRAPLERCRGYGVLARMEDRSELATSVSVSVASRVRVAINPFSGTAQDDMLYSVEQVMPLAEGDDSRATSTVFVGTCAMTAEHRALLEEALRCVKSSDKAAWNVRLGAGQSRGFGAGRLWLSPKPMPLDNEQALVADTPDERRTLVVTLRSPTVLLDGRGTAALSLTRQVLESYYDHARRLGLRLRRAFAVADVAAGWSSAWGLPKHLQTAIGAGSVFVFDVSPESPSDLLRALQSDLTRCGLGERREEGFGQVSVNHRVHLSYRLEVEEAGE